MLKENKEGHKGPNATESDNLYTVLGFLVTALVFGLAVAVCLICYEDPSSKSTNGQCVSTENALISDSLDGQSGHMEIALAVAVYSGSTMKNLSSYREIIFSNNLNDNLYLYYCEKSGTVRHYDYNHPFYVESGDLCEIWVDGDGDEKTVKLIRNLTKAELANTEVYFDCDYFDPD